jgi:hypothetical protein
VFEGRDGDQVGDGKFSVFGQKVLSRQKIILEQLMRFHVLGPKFCENILKLFFSSKTFEFEVSAKLS